MRVSLDRSQELYGSHGYSKFKFFYAQLKAAHSRNNIAFICNEHGVQMTYPNQVKQKLTIFFQQFLGNRA